MKDGPTALPINQDKKQVSFGLLNVIVLVLSVYILVTLFISTFFKLPEEQVRLLNFIDNIICVFFLIEFFIRFFRADNKLKFMRWGWVDLLSSIPMLDVFRGGRILRLVRLLRILRAFRSATNLFNHIFEKRASGTFTMVAIVAVLTVIFSAIAILQVEDDPNSNIKTAEDALWWAYVTVTTVGYGDKYPVTTEGRLIAVLLMTTGVGLFGTFAGFVSSWFLNSRKQAH